MSVILEITTESPAEDPPPATHDDAAVEEVGNAEDDLQVDDPSLLAALQQHLHWRHWTPRNRGLFLAFLLAVGFHVLVVAACLALAVKLHVFSPRLNFARGPSEGDLVAETDAPAIDDHALASPEFAMPPAARTSAAQQPAPDESDLADAPAQSTRETQIDPQLDPADPLAFGVHADPIGPMPRWQRSSTGTATVAHPHTSDSSKTASERLASGSAMAQAVPVQHTYVPPHGAGRGGGDQGAGYDQRGIPIPEYPPESYRRREEGTVELQVMVRADGAVGRVNIAKSSGFPRLDQAAVVAVQAAHFTPGTCDGTPTAMEVIIPFRFVIQ